MPRSSRSLSDLVADLQRVHDVAPAGRGESEDRGYTTLFQCPSCGRFVSEKATTCACGVRFASSVDTFLCPECGSRVPSLEDACPVCRVRFEEDAPRLAYACPSCGASVSADAIRCSCGAWFED